MASASNISFGARPFDATAVRNNSGLQIVGGEVFIGIETATEQSTFDASNANVIVFEATWAIRFGDGGSVYTLCFTNRPSGEK